MDVYWTLLILGFLALFVVGESYAIRNGKTTLSRYTWNASQAWPPLPFVLGLIVGGLAVHFWWPWCPALGLGNG